MFSSLPSRDTISLRNFCRAHMRCEAAKMQILN
jgi:hypothetical protein